MLRNTNNIRFFATSRPSVLIGLLSPESNLDEFSQLCRNTFHATYPSLFTNDAIEKIYQDFRHTELPNELKSGEYHYLYAICAGKYVGYAKLNIAASAEAHLHKLYVLKEYHHQGIGLRLLTEAMHIAQEKKQTSLSLFVWEGNAAAIHFYEKCGFQFTRQTSNNFGGQAVKGHVMSIRDIGTWLTMREKHEDYSVRLKN